MSGIADLLPVLHQRLVQDTNLTDFAPDALSALPTTGLAHDHVTIAGTKLLLRVPRQSQMRLDAARNLAYQAACFERMADSGHTPHLYDVLAPGSDLPMGALLVDCIQGRTARLPEDLPAIAEALAAIHALPLPESDKRPPLLDQLDPLPETLKEVEEQARFLVKAGLHPDSLAMIREELFAARDALGSVPVTLITFDAHPGNFMMDDDGRAWLVDLEKGRYGGAGFDLAHVTLYTSTTWDVATYSEPDRMAIAGFYQHWRNRMPQALGDALLPHLMSMRRLMWLWSITWCAKWRVESDKSRVPDKDRAADTEDWSGDNSDAALIEHVRNRVDHYLEPETISRVIRDWTVDPIC